MKKKMSVTAVICSMVYGQSQMLRDPGINVDLEGHSNPLEYFELLCTPEIAEIIAREISVPKNF
jgi:hypothetical protein